MAKQVSKPHQLTNSSETAHFNFGYQLNVQIHDIEFEEGTAEGKEKSEVGFYCYRNMKFVDMCDLEDPHVVMVPMRNAKKEEVVRIIVQNQDDDTFFGSISLLLKRYFLHENMIENKKYTQWITLFDEPEDDEFDGDLEEDDEDLPRIHCTFSITQVKKPERDQGSTGMDGKFKSTVAHAAFRKFCTNLI